jgi:uroporphyrinogen-III synthase
VLVLVTRPRDQAAGTARLLEAMGHEAIVDPVLEIRPLPVPPLDLADVAAVAVTSANAAHALSGLAGSLPVYAVGGATAAAARAACDADVRVAEGDGAALAGLIRRTLSPASGAILHLSGADVRETLEAALAEAGFAYRQAVVYEARPTPSLAPETAAALREGRLGAVLFYSPRSAELWAAKVARAGLAGMLGPVIAACLSEAVAERLRPLRFAALRVAAARDQDQLLRCLEGPRRR